MAATARARNLCTVILLFTWAGLRGDISRPSTILERGKDRAEKLYDMLSIMVDAFHAGTSQVQWSCGSARKILFSTSVANSTAEAPVRAPPVPIRRLCRDVLLLLV